MLVLLILLFLCFPLIGPLFLQPKYIIEKQQQLERSPEQSGLTVTKGQFYEEEICIM